MIPLCVSQLVEPVIFVVQQDGTGGNEIVDCNDCSGALYLTASSMNRIFGSAIRSSTASSRFGIFACSKDALCELDLYTLNVPVVSPVPVLKSLTTMRQLQHQQMRWFAAKVKYNLKGFGPNGYALKICFCYSEYDLYAKPKSRSQEQYLYTKSRCTLKEIKEHTKNEFETCDDLEYFTGTEWLPLTNVKDIESFKGGEKVLNIRVPSRWDEFIQVDGMNNERGVDLDEPSNVPMHRSDCSMKLVVETLIMACKFTDMTRSRVRPYYLQQCDQKEISTKQWVLNVAAEDQFLRSILLQQPGTLDHLVQCLHFDFAWKKFKDAEPRINPSNDNQIQYGSISKPLSE
jgi:hypothetical protein